MRRLQDVSAKVQSGVIGHRVAAEEVAGSVPVLQERHHLPPFGRLTAFVSFSPFHHLLLTLT